jgi:hydroxypyruvate isomerase
VPGYLLDDFGRAAALIRQLGLPNVKLQFDIYHCQILHGDITMRLREMFPIIGHIQTASIPLRNEPGSGELNDALIFAELDRLGYAGFIGCEYRPASGTEAGLDWFAPYRPAR